MLAGQLSMCQDPDRVLIAKSEQDAADLHAPVRDAVESLGNRHSQLVHVGTGVLDPHRVPGRLPLVQFCVQCRRRRNEPAFPQSDLIGLGTLMNSYILGRWGSTVQLPERIFAERLFMRYKLAMIPRVVAAILVINTTIAAQDSLHVRRA